MSRMISQILDLARVRAQGFRLSPCPGDLLQICRAVQEELEPSGVERRLVIESAGETGAILDPDRVVQMLTNLASNALEHGAPGSPVRICIDGNRPDVVTISIHNRGSIAPESLPGLFQSFGSLSVPERSSGRGLGLGLHIARHIAGLHGGSVTGENEPPDGVVFKVVLPRSLSGLGAVR